MAKKIRVYYEMYETLYTGSRVVDALVSKVVDVDEKEELQEFDLPWLHRVVKIEDVHNIQKGDQ